MATGNAPNHVVIQKKITINVVNKIVMEKLFQIMIFGPSRGLCKIK